MMAFSAARGRIRGVEVVVVGVRSESSVRSMTLPVLELPEVALFYCCIKQVS